SVMDATNSFEPAPNLPIGKKKYLCVEYPAIVKNTHRAIDAMGGEKALAASLVHETPIELRFRPGDPFSHPINGDIVPSSKLLVKVTRRVKSGQPTEEAEIKTELLGTVSKTLRFRTLADFQYIVPETDRIARLKRAMIAGNAEEILNYRVPPDDGENEADLHNIPPPVFSATEMPASYKYRQSSPVVRVKVKQPDGSYVVKLINKSRKREFAMTSIHYEDENILFSLLRNRHSIFSNEILISLFRQLFEERPIWSKNALKHVIPVKDHKFMGRALVSLGYTFANGPWRECWVRYGLDPRKDRKYAIYQILDVRRTTRGSGTSGPRPVRTRLAPRSTLSNSRISTNNGHIFDGKNKATLTAMFQLCDVTDPDINPLIHNQTYMRSVCTKITGFYYACTLERIRTAVRKKQDEFRSKGEASRISNLEVGLAKDIVEEVAKEEREAAAAAESASQAANQPSVPIKTEEAETAVRDAQLLYQQSDQNLVDLVRWNSRDRRIIANILRM
ncbi:RNA polymerase III transcription factor IIIC subunit-domain-containing protein, partial [Radiomyces spectabilis]|uniref:RNA polymerase III transcription factor IIIC subunit-domain-containing protein n=1 Tax=Radiomyces spectabilis TaxID=64574 RepID=UPI00221F1D55